MLKFVVFKRLAFAPAFSSLEFLVGRKEITPLLVVA